ncbi:MAG: flagellar hook-basal body protein [Planctomycetota bacterium]
MIQGIYSLIASAGISDFAMNVRANNLANIQTVGFLSDEVIVRQRIINDTIFNNIYKPGYIEYLSGLVIDKTVTSLKKGRIETTNNPLDFAVEGEDEFFTVEDEKGKYLTRAGNFAIDDEGFLVTQDKKYYVSGKSGRIKIDDVNSLISDSNGRLYIRGTLIDQLLIHKLTEKMPLVKLGDNLLEIPKEKVEVSDEPIVLHKHLEYANVEPLRELTRIIETQRAFEIAMNLVRIQDEMLERIATETTRVSI